MSHARSEYAAFRMQASDIHDALSSLGKLATKAGLDKELIELIKIRASQINGCAFCLQYHILQAEAFGLSTDKINLVAVWREVALFSRRERAALAWTETLTVLAGGVSDEIYAEASAEFSEGIALPHLGGIGHQRLESLWRRLSLAAASTAQQGASRRLLSALSSRRLRPDRAARSPLASSRAPPQVLRPSPGRTRGRGRGSAVHRRRSA